DAADGAGLDRLAVNRSSAGLWIALETHTQGFAEYALETVPGSIQPPRAQITVDCLPPRPFLRQEAPGSASPQLVEKGVENRAQPMHTGTAGGRVRRQQRLDEGPFGVGQIGSVQRGERVHAPPSPKPSPARFEL